jgi:hypothetical protein
MTNMIKDRLIFLATAQECLADVTEKMDRLDEAQFVMENSAFEAMNVSDKVLNFSKDGSLLAGKLMECCSTVAINSCDEEKQKLISVLGEIHELFRNISAATVELNEISHRIEREAASQKEIQDDIKKAHASVKESLDSAVACAELVLTES